METKNEEDRYLRQRDVFTPADSEKTQLTLVGCGGIGSWTGFILSKLGIANVTLFDPDIVEPKNLASQFFETADIGKNKAIALGKKLKKNGTFVVAIDAEYDMSGKEDILIIAVDSIKIRKTIAEALVKSEHCPKYIIDGRMGLEQMEIYVYATPTEWLADLPDENKVDHEPCTAKAIAYNTSVIGGLVSSIVKKIIKQEVCAKKIIFDLKTYIFIN